jgi:hypothetical protein
LRTVRGGWRAGAARARLAAGEFWQATPAELAAILAPDDAPGGEPLSRAN